jgi:hypothetical protein
VIDVTNPKQHDVFFNLARNRWYSISLALSESDGEMRIRDLCVAAGIPNDRAMRDFFDKWGDTMVEKYGKLPYTKLNSSRYEKYMEMK